MNATKYKEAKKAFQDIDQLLKEGNLSPEQIEHFQTLRSQLAGVLARPLLPADWGRRVIMIFVSLIGLYGMVDGPALLSLIWIVLPMFSPRIVGEVAYALVRIRAK